MEDDERTSQVIKNIANSVNPMIQMEEDYPSKYSDGKILILDLNFSMNNEGLIQFEHFKGFICHHLYLFFSLYYFQMYSKINNSQFRSYNHCLCFTSFDLSLYIEIH